MKTIKTPLCGLALASAAVLSQEGTSLQSDWIELVKGHKGKTMGVELRDIAPESAEGERAITFAVPKASMSHPDTIEEVVVIARGPDAPEPAKPLKIRYQWLSDYDEDNYGLVIHLGEGNWPIRLFLNSSAGFIEE